MIGKDGMGMEIHREWSVLLIKELGRLRREALAHVRSTRNYAIIQTWIQRRKLYTLLYSLILNYHANTQLLNKYKSIG